MSETVLKIEGMTCDHCKMRVEGALKGVPGVNGVRVDLPENRAVVSGPAKRAVLAEAVHDAGYKVID